VSGDAGDARESAGRETYQHFRGIFGVGSLRSADSRRRAQREPGSTIPYGLGRDPEHLGSVIGALTSKLGWDSSLAQSELLDSWAQIVGVETAEHSSPVSIDDGVLAVRCESTTWATQLRLMRVLVMTNITTRYPDAGIDSVRFEGPGAPSWKRGPRSIPGRGPRDTYG